MTPRKVTRLATRLGDLAISVSGAHPGHWVVDLEIGNGKVSLPADAVADLAPALRLALRELAALQNLRRRRTRGGEP